MIETKGAQTPAEDPRNRGRTIWLNGRLVPRGEAVVSIFDAGSAGGVMHRVKIVTKPSVGILD